ncbi:MAG TPA: glutamate-cysteine ligase family protein [Pyrinomonadaceae bacterium]|nr:glutamate-cysteine ligase family protein [Pyrinomonadaceae bacterium]
MGEHNVAQELDELKEQMFMKALLEDLRALDYMLDNDLIESGVRRIGAEQEMFLVDENLRPSPVSVEVLQHANDPRLTTEIARFNLEANLTPLGLSGDCFSQMESQLNEVLARARVSANHFGADVLLSGILPTLRKSDLTLENLTPAPRYKQLNDSVIRLRGGPFSIHIKGLDEINLTHDNIMMESCNTSFQIHFQVSPKEFAPLYNLAQAITAPVLAAAVNSPLLFGHRLWHETRLALFQHSTDARSATQQARSHPTRVSFGNRWVDKSVLELFQEQIARFRLIMINEISENPLSLLARGEIPQLSALRMHNGTIWPWNRACYGVAKGIAHLRIENRVLPSGPTVLDEIANTAFFVGLMLSLPGEYGEVSKVMSFDDAKTNFFAAARHGLNAQFNWVDGRSVAASALILDHLLPLAHQGLKQANVTRADADQYLGVIEERVRSGQTGSQWTMKSLNTLSDKPCEVRNRLLAREMLARQKTGDPVHRWPVLEACESDDWSQGYQTVGQFMATDLFTVRPDDLVDLAASVMTWRHIRHVPVEDNEGRLVGLVSHRSLLKLLSQGSLATEGAVTVREIMTPEPLTVSSTTPTLEAMEIMRRHRVGCLPILDDGRLVGIVTSYDFLDASARLFKEQLTTNSVSLSNDQPAVHQVRAAGAGAS